MIRDSIRVFGLESSSALKEFEKRSRRCGDRFMVAAVSQSSPELL